MNVFRCIDCGDTFILGGPKDGERVEWGDRPTSHIFKRCRGCKADRDVSREGFKV